MKKKTILLLIAVTFLLPFESFAFEGVYTLIIKKQEKKRRSRWTLASWMALKRQMALQDRWLALNTSDTSYEGYVGGGYSFFGSDLGEAKIETVQAPEADLGFYYSIFGFQGRWVNEGLESSGGSDASMHMRILGGSVQNSNITLGAGVRDRSEVFNTQEIRFSNPYGEALLNFYVFKFLGVKGTYRHFFPVDNAGVQLEGHRIEGGAFIDMSFFQIYLNYFKQPLKFTESGTSTSIETEGYTGGIKLYF